MSDEVQILSNPDKNQGMFKIRTPFKPVKELNSIRGNLRNINKNNNALSDYYNNQRTNQDSMGTDNINIKFHNDANYDANYVIYNGQNPSPERKANRYAAGAGAEKEHESFPSSDNKQDEGGAVEKEDDGLETEGLDDNENNDDQNDQQNKKQQNINNDEWINISDLKQENNMNHNDVEDNNNKNINDSEQNMNQTQQQKDIYCVIKSSGQGDHKPDFTKARHFAKKIFTSETQLEPMMAHMYTLKENFTLVTERNDTNQVVFLVHISNMQPEDVKYLSTYKYKSQIGSQLSFSLHKPSILQLTQIQLEKTEDRKRAITIQEKRDEEDLEEDDDEEDEEEGEDEEEQNEEKEKIQIQDLQVQNKKQVDDDRRQEQNQNAKQPQQNPTIQLQKSRKSSHISNEDNNNKIQEKFIKDHQMKLNNNSEHFAMLDLNDQSSFPDIAKICVGFINKAHFENQKYAGKIFLGISEKDNKVVGIDLIGKNNIDVFSAYLFDKSMPSISELIDIQQIPISTDEEEEIQNKFVVLITISRSQHDQLIMLMNCNSEQDLGVYFQRQENTSKTRKMLTSSLINYVPERFSKKNLKYEIEKLERQIGLEPQSPEKRDSSPTRQRQNSGKVVLRRHQQNSSIDHHSQQNYQSGKKNLPNLDEGSPLKQQQQQQKQNQQENKSSINNKMPQKREVRSFSTDPNNKQHNIFKQNYSNQIKLIQSNKRTILPSKTDQQDIYQNVQIENQKPDNVFKQAYTSGNFISNVLKNSGQDQKVPATHRTILTSENRNYQMNANNIRKSYNHPPNSNQNNMLSQSIKQNLSCLPPSTENNNNKLSPLKQQHQTENDQVVCANEFDQFGFEERPSQDNFLMNKNASIKQRENMLATIGMSDYQHHNNENNFNAGNILHNNNKQKIKLRKSSGSYRNNVSQNSNDINSQKVSFQHTNANQGKISTLEPISSFDVKVRSISSQNH